MQTRSTEVKINQNRLSSMVGATVGQICRNKALSFTRNGGGKQNKFRIIRMRIHLNPAVHATERLRETIIQVIAHDQGSLPFFDFGNLGNAPNQIVSNEDFDVPG